MNLSTQKSKLRFTNVALTVYKFISANKLKTTISLIIIIAYYFCLPNQLFNAPTATVIESNKGELLGASIAADGQWRFPHNDSIPKKFKQCLLLFEDEYFYNHPGINPISIIKAFKQNLSSGSIKRGGSTLTQQTIRLSRKGRARNYFEKLKELILATRLELKFSKEKILAYYTSNAPFGGNTVGLDAAAWRYFNRSANDLSWAENATLAVLPNAPSLIYPGKNQKKLLFKRNRLLRKLLNRGNIDSLTYTLSIAENLPQKPFPLPQIAPHLLQKIAQTNFGKRVKTTINKTLQIQANQIVKNHYLQLKQNEIYNIAVLVLDVKTRQVLSYIGNSPTDNSHQKDVNIIDKPRSTGSILKPFLHAALLDAGELLPNTLVADIPTSFANYTPKNYNREYDGMVPVKQALSRSLNIPSVRLLQEFGLDRFHQYLKQLKLKDIKYNANHYGLSLILGGAESNLWDLCKSYAALSSTLNHYAKHSSQYFSNEFVEPTLLHNEPINFGKLLPEKNIFDAASIYLTYDALKEVNRPQGNENWTFYNASKQIAWKTGTSYGFRDAWAIGSTKNYVVGVWVGNADGEGRPGLVGVETAAPILFDVFDLLPNSDWFDKPFDEMQSIAICEQSGYRSSTICPNIKNDYVQLSGLKTKPCPYHILVHLDAKQTNRVNTSCEPLTKIKTKPWFVLPPIMAYYYQQKNPFYKALPSFRSDCVGTDDVTLDFIYPDIGTTIFLPKDFDGKTNELVLKVAYSNPEKTLFWYLNTTYLGTTKQIHEFGITPKKGKHLITVVDEFGNDIKRYIEIK